MMATQVFLQAQSYTPLINDISPPPLYNGVQVKLGETQEHFSYAPNLQKNASGKIVFIVMGASTQGQIATALVQQSYTLKDVVVINCCVGSEDVNKWLLLTESGWANVNKQLQAKGYTKADVQGIIYGSDDLRDGSILFPQAPQALAAKNIELIKLCKSQLPNLKVFSLQSRLCEYKIADKKFQAPSGYFTGFANKFTVEASFTTGHLINGVWPTDADWYLWTNGEQMRSDGFQFRFSWMKQRQTSVHLDTRLSGDDECAAYGFNKMKRYPYWK